MLHLARTVVSAVGWLIGADKVDYSRGFHDGVQSVLAAQEIREQQRRRAKALSN